MWILLSLRSNIGFRAHICLFYFRFSLLGLEPGEIYFLDYSVVYSPLSPELSEQETIQRSEFETLGHIINTTTHYTLHMLSFTNKYKYIFFKYCEFNILCTSNGHVSAIGKSAVEGHAKLCGSFSRLLYNLIWCSSKGESRGGGGGVSRDTLVQLEMLMT